jgi:hypothetical protein
MKMKLKEKRVYGLFVIKLDKIGPRDQYVAAYGTKKNVLHYKEYLNLKGDVKEYKKQGWLVRRLESLSVMYKEDIKLLCVDK